MEEVWILLDWESVSKHKQDYFPTKHTEEPNKSKYNWTKKEGKVQRKQAARAFWSNLFLDLRAFQFILN